ncbi:MAG: enoyl-CoA hydratase/isomerase family protein [Oscillospiraceae bacterium]|nr:enoyl-CoA hydratase/isomerase family protein [Oscillospiraceae bacterium]
MSYQYFKCSIADGIAVFTIDRPEARNAMNAACWEEVNTFFQAVEDMDEVRTVIFTGAGEKVFIAGGDLAVLHKRSGVENLRPVCKIAQIALQRIEDCNKPVICAINGHAFGGGLETAMVCDIRIAADHAKFALPETSLGIIPGAGGTQRLARIVGIGRAKEMILAGRTLTAQEAVEAGLVMKAVPQDTLLKEAKVVAQKIMERGPVAIAVAKKLINASMDVDRYTGQAMENLGSCFIYGTKDKYEGTLSFLEKRKPTYCGE